MRLYDLREYLLSSFPFLPMEEYTSLGRWQKLRILLHFSVTVVAEQRADGAMSTENLEQKKRKSSRFVFEKGSTLLLIQANYVLREVAGRGLSEAVHIYGFSSVKLKRLDGFSPEQKAWAGTV